MAFGLFSTRPRRSCSSTRAPEKLLGLGREGRTWSYRTTGPPVRPSCRFALASWTSSGLAGASGGTSNSRSSPLRRSRNGAGDGRRLHQIPTPQAAHLRVPNILELFDFLANQFPTHTVTVRFFQQIFDLFLAATFRFPCRTSLSLSVSFLFHHYVRTRANFCIQIKTQRRKAFRTIQWDPGRLFIGRRPGSH